MLNEKGQLILTLVLVMTVALAIGLSIVQKSLVDVSTATKVEQSSRAFSAAEAGIEKALKGNTSLQDLGNDASIKEINDSNFIPAIPPANTQQAPLEYPPLAKEDIAHFWLADLNSTAPSSPPACGPSISCYYAKNSLDVYWGNPATTDKAALELTLVYFNGTQYVPQKWYLDNGTSGRNLPNFTAVSCSNITPVGGAQAYQCKFSLTSLPPGLILLRGRLLYNTTSQPIAIAAVWPCSGAGCFIPPQARNIISTGISGETQRKVKLFQINKVVPPYFDYAIFSAGAINKN